MQEYGSVYYPVMAKIFRMLEDYNISKKQILDAVDIREDSFFTQKKITFQQYNDILNQAAILTNDPFLSLHSAEFFDLIDMGIVGYVMMNCDNLRESFDKYIEFSQLVAEGEEILVSIHDQEIKVSYNILDKTIENCRQLIESVFSSFCQMYYLLTGQRITINRVLFKHPAPTNTQTIEQYFQAQVLFNQVENALVFSPEILQVPLKQPNQELLHLFESHARKSLIDFSANKKYRSLVKDMCLKEFSRCIPKIDELAQKFGMTSRNLQLKLQNEGSSYRKIINELYQYKACDYLSDKSLSVSEISDYMGFSSPGSFIRAFKRWTGITPDQYRNS